ncbi:MAG: hypothetical protein D6702_11490 [Planctomycetota bacterium]|nr:MAG: hypothetical protein D6702_11490 [Planctomycetota bacterium]
MRLILPCLFLAAAPAAAQQTFLSEDFESGVVPPAGWTEVNNGNSLGWETSSGFLYGSTEAFHDDFFGWNDNLLVSPQMDLSGATTVWAHCRQYVVYASWRDHHYVDVSLDNGVTFINAHDDLAGDGESALSVDLSAWGGINGVNLAYHYTGDYASEWRLDEIAVTDSATPPPPPPPAILATFVNPTNGHTYHLLESTNWTLAEAAAVALGAHLATIEDQAENDWVTQTFGTWGGVQRDLWIGLNDAAVEGSYVWADGSTSTWTNYAPGEPNNSTVNDPVHGEDYIHIYGAGALAGQWNDMHDTSLSWGNDLYGLVEIGGPRLSVANLVAGQAATVSGGNFSPNGLVRIGYSLTGGGPTSTPYGPVDLSPPIRETPPQVADPAGAFSFTAPVPASLAGRPIWLQAFDLGSLTFSNALAEVVG